MKLMLPIPIQKIQVGPCAVRFRHEVREVEVIAISRTSAGPNRWHYTAHYIHPDAHPECPRAGLRGSLIAWVRRASHPAFKPNKLAFIPGKANTVVFGDEGGQQ